MFRRDDSEVSLLGADVLGEGAELELWPSDVGFPTNPPRLTALRLELRAQPREQWPRR